MIPELQGAHLVPCWEPAAPCAATAADTALARVPAPRLGVAASSGCSKALQKRVQQVNNTIFPNPGSNYVGMVQSHLVVEVPPGAAM